MSSDLFSPDINSTQLLAGSNGSGFDDYKKMVDAYPALVIVFDANKKKFGYVNKQFYSLLGYTELDLSATDFNLDKIIFEDDREKFKEEYQKCFDLKDDESYSYNNRLANKTGKWFYFRTKGTVLRRQADGKPEALLFIAENITEHQLSTEELRKTKELVSETEKMHLFGMYSYDHLTDTFTWSDGIYNLFEVDRETAPQPNYSFFKRFVLPEDQQQVDRVRQQILTGTSEYEHVFSIQTKHGGIKILLDIVRGVRGDNGEVVKFIGSLRDITKERLNERELHRHIKELHSSNKELEDFAYVASHDMQEPLRKITTFSTRLFDKFSTELGSEGKTYLERMNVAASNMRMLIENLLEISRTSRGTHSFEVTDLNESVQAAINELELSIEENHATINIADKLPQIEAVPSLITQLFSNLFNNAIKFRSASSPVITVSARTVTKYEREKLLLPEKAFFEIKVTDNGIGFEQEYADKIFQIFQRLHGKAVYPGSGIGLSICKKIVEKHNGIIYAKGELNKGTSFFVVLPEKQ